MTRKRIHIVAFDVPFPPDYGGVLDIYWRCKTLKEMGYYVVLHAYEYGRGRNHEYREIADEVHYYKRSTKGIHLLSLTPYIVQSRRSKQLLNRLLEDNDPILFEGQHTSYWIDKLANNDRVVAIRSHNVEWKYYANLEKSAVNPLKKLFFGIESKKLKAHETKMSKVPICCITESDTSYYRSLGFEAYHLPVSLHQDLLLPNKADHGFALFHGNLSVAENVSVIHELLKENKRQPFHLPLIIAGKNPSTKLKKRIEQVGWKCVANPSDKALNELMSTCTLHLLIAQHSAGIKMKALRALMSGKPCVVSIEMVAHSGLEKHCEIWNRGIPLAEFIEQQKGLNSEDLESRQRTLMIDHGPTRLKEVLEEIGIEKRHFF